MDDHVPYFHQALVDVIWSRAVSGGTIWVQSGGAAQSDRPVHGKIKLQLHPDLNRRIHHRKMKALTAEGHGTVDIYQSPEVMSQLLLSLFFCSFNRVCMFKVCAIQRPLACGVAQHIQNCSTKTASFFNIFFLQQKDTAVQMCRKEIGPLLGENKLLLYAHFEWSDVSHLSF